MRFWKSILSVVLMTMLLGSVAGCQPKDDTVLKVGATPVPHAEILEHIKPMLEKQGVKLEIIVFNDYVQPNLALDKGEIDANYFQHIPYLDAFTKDHNLNLIALTKVHIEPMGLYSRKVGKLEDLQNGAQIAVPNDVADVGRALAILAKAGLIELTEGVGVKGTIEDIISNDKALRITPLDAATLPRVLDDPKVAGAIINGNYALGAGLNPVQDAILLESGDSPYANILAVKAGRENDEAIKALDAALRSDEVKRFIEEKYEGSVIPIR